LCPACVSTSPTVGPVVPVLAHAAVSKTPGIDNLSSLSNSNILLANSSPVNPF